MSFKLNNRMRDITGQTFNRLTGVKPVGKTNDKVLWEFLCSCGNTVTAVLGNVTAGKTASCGCLRKETARGQGRNNQRHKYNTKHEHKRLYNQWLGMHVRCYNIKDTNSTQYKLNSIQVCQAWHDWDNYAKWALSHGYTDELSIDRLDILDDYRPDNVEYVQLQENSRRSVRDQHIKRLEELL